MPLLVPFSHCGSCDLIVALVASSSSFLNKRSVTVPNNGKHGISRVVLTLESLFCRWKQLMTMINIATMWQDLLD